MNTTTAKELLEKSLVVFWDFDGVIKDSVMVKSRAFENLFLPYGDDIALRVRLHHEAHGGVSRYEKIPLYLEWAGEKVTKDIVELFCTKFAEKVLQEVIDSPWVPGVRDYLVLHYLKQRFILVTATPQNEIEIILSALDLTQYFYEIHGSPKSKGKVIKETIALLNIPSEKALMVGDSETDLTAAVVNNINFLLRNTIYNKSLQKKFSGLTFSDLKNA